MDRLWALKKKAAGLLCLGAMTACQIAPSTMTEPTKDDVRPNIVIVLVDDQRYDAFGALTDGLETPFLDRLISEGVRFENAFVTTSLCSPSRASIMSGQTMRNHGIVDNNSPTPEGFEPFSVLLDEAGYDTAFIGKWHMGSADASPKPGFDHWVSFEGQGNYDPIDAFGRPSLLNVNGIEVPQTGYITDELTAYATNWLDTRSDAPFMLFVSHKAVHLPFSPAERHRGQYDRLELESPPSDKPDARQGPRPMWLTMQNNSWHGTGFAFYSNIPIEDLQRTYYSALSGVDDSMGRLFEALESQGNGRDTIIIYTSDNGFMFGEHGLVDKRAAYEASIRVPMIVHAPGLLDTGTTNPVLVRNIDIAPTVLSLAGVDIPERYEGRDMLSVDATTDDEALIYEYYWEFNYPQTPSTFAIRTDRYKYIQYHGVWDTEELFDLETDPDELVNLIADPAYHEILIKLRADLFEAISQDGARPSIPFTERFNQGAVFWSDDVSSSVAFPEHWQRNPDAADKYEHILPDGPGKAAQLDAITPTLRDILDAKPSEDQP